MTVIADDLSKAGPKHRGRAAAEFETFVPTHRALEAGADRVRRRFIRG